MFQEFRDVAHGTKHNKIASDRFYAIERVISVRLSWWLYRLFPNIYPTSITVVSLAILAVVFTLTTVLWYVPQAVWLYTLGSLALLYVISFTDKVDGELARVRDYRTQKGLFLDRTVHFIYPFVFYFLIGTFFVVGGGEVVLFALTLLLGVLTQQFLFLTEAKLLVAEKIKKDGVLFKDLLTARLPKHRPLLPLRLLDYLTFMIYAWTLFFYVGIILLALWYPAISYLLYVSHVLLALSVNGYKVFISYPRDRLYTREEAEALMRP